MAAITLGVIAVGLTAASYSQQRKAAKETAKANRAQQRQAELANARERRNAVRSARVARGSSEAQASLTGMSGGSAAELAVSNIQNQLGENLNFLDNQQALADEAGRANQKAADYSSRAQGYADLASLASKGASTYGG